MMTIVLFPLKLIATIVLFILKISFSILSFLALAFSFPFVLLSDLLGGLIALISAVGLGAMLLCWCFGSFDGKTLLIITFFTGLLSAFFFAAEEIAAFIHNKLEDISYPHNNPASTQINKTVIK